MQVAPSGRVCIPLFLHNNVMALFAITFSGGNGIVLFLLTLGLKAQKRLARAERQRRPELMCHTIVALQVAKALLRYLLAECDFSKLSNKICTIDVKIHIFASSIKRNKKMKIQNFGKPLSRLITLVAICMLSLHAMAYDFSYTHQGTTLYYNITSDNTVDVAGDNSVSGAVVIPSSVTLNSATLLQI